LRTKREKKKEDGTRKERRTEKKENRTECDSNELTIYNEEKKKIDDRSYVCMFVALCFFKHIEEEEEKRKRQNIDFNIISSFFSLYRIPVIIIIIIQ